MENTLYQFPGTIKAHSKIFLPKEGIYPMIDTEYIGKAAASCISSDDIDSHHGKYYEMSGPELLTPQDVAAVLTKVLNKNVEWSDLPPQAVESMPKYFAEIIDHFKKYREKSIPFSQDVQKLVGRNGTYEEFLRKHLDAFNI